MPWKDKVKGILAGCIGGEAGGKAVVDCILGNVNPMVNWLKLILIN